MVFALDEFFWITCHIITEVVEAEFVVCSVGDVGEISVTTCLRVRFMLVDAVYGETEKFIYRSHPLGVTFREVIVNGNYVNTATCESVEIYRESRD